MTVVDLLGLLVAPGPLPGAFDQDRPQALLPDRAQPRAGRAVPAPADNGGKTQIGSHLLGTVEALRRENLRQKGCRNDLADPADLRQSRVALRVQTLRCLPDLALSRTRFPWTQNWLNRSVQGGPEHDR